MPIVPMKPGDTHSLWSAKALSNIAVGAVSDNVVEFEPTQAYVYGVFTYSFDTAPTAVCINIEHSDGGGNVWRRVTQIADPNGGTFILRMAPGKYRAVLVSKTGTTQQLTLTLKAFEEFPSEANVPEFNDLVTPNGAKLKFVALSEEITLATGALTTDSTQNLLPANSEILGVVGRVTTTINNITNWQLGDPTTAGRFCPVQTGLAAGSTVVGMDHRQPTVATAAAGPIQAAAAKLRVTCTGTQNSAGKIRVTVFAIQYVAPSS